MTTKKIFMQSWSNFSMSHLISIPLRQWISQPRPSTFSQRASTSTTCTMTVQGFFRTTAVSIPQKRFLIILIFSWSGICRQKRNKLPKLHRKYKPSSRYSSFGLNLIPIQTSGIRVWTKHNPSVYGGVLSWNQKIFLQKKKNKLQQRNNK